MKHFTKWWKWISHLGTQHAKSFSETKSVILTNKVSIFVALLGSVIALQYYFAGLNLVVQIQLVSILFFLLPLPLNHFGRNFLAKATLILSTNISLFFTSSILGYSSGEHYAYFALVMAPFLFFEREKKIIVWFFAALPIVGLIVLELTHYSLFSASGITEEIQRQDYVLSVTATVLIIIITVNYFKNLSQKHIQNIVEDAQEELKAIFDNSYDAIFVVDPATKKIIDCNQRAIGFFKVSSKNALLEKNIFLLQKTPLSDAALQAIYQELERHKRYIAEKEYETFHGEQFWGNLAITAVQLEDKNFLLARITDVSNIKKAEAETKKALEELRQRNHELDSFVYSTSHDLRAPIASMLGLVDIAKQEKNLEIIYQYLNLVEESSERLDKVIQTILDYSKSVNASLSFSTIDFQQTIDACIDDLRYMPNAKRLQFQVDVEQPIQFISDAFRVTTILKNLVSNAIKYQNMMVDGSYSRFSIQVNKKEAVISVQDNGIGIREDQMDKIFEMFYRGTQKGSGSGLGLYITKLNVEKLQGTIEIESEYGEGTQFVICLPNHLVYESVPKIKTPAKS